MNEQERPREHAAGGGPAGEPFEDAGSARAAAQRIAASGLAKIKALIEPKESAAFLEANRQTNGQ
jgi:hypothetical protein